MLSVTSVITARSFNLDAHQQMNRQSVRGVYHKGRPTTTELKMYKLLLPEGKWL